MLLLCTFFYLKTGGFLYSSVFVVNEELIFFIYLEGKIDDNRLQPGELRGV
jgi:hypothetical protein